MSKLSDLVANSERLSDALQKAEEAATQAQNKAAEIRDELRAINHQLAELLGLKRPKATGSANNAGVEPPAHSAMGKALAYLRSESPKSLDELVDELGVSKSGLGKAMLRNGDWDLAEVPSAELHMSA